MSALGCCYHRFRGLNPSSLVLFLRSAGILKYFAKEKLLSQQHLQLFWDAKDVLDAKAVYSVGGLLRCIVTLGAPSSLLPRARPRQVIGELIVVLPRPSIEFIADQLVNFPPESFTKHTVDLMAMFNRYLNYRHPDLADAIVMKLWAVVQDAPQAQQPPAEVFK